MLRPTTATPRFEQPQSSNPNRPPHPDAHLHRQHADGWRQVGVDEAGVVDALVIRLEARVLGQDAHAYHLVGGHMGGWGGAWGGGVGG